MVIKYGSVAAAYNLGLQENNPRAYIDTADERTWRYYQNIAGIYHTTDTVMDVISLDTNTPITFDKTTLQTHPQTKEAYLFGSALHAELISKYPQQINLILGILYAPDRTSFIDEVVNAADGTLLYFDTRFVEPQEHSLIYTLQQWLYSYTKRWYNADYARIDNLYMADFMWKLSYHVAQKLYTVRQKNSKTEQAHTFYVRQYLASHGALDLYMDLLTQEQIIFLYRNILYIENHSGRQEVFYWLVENLMTVRNLPLFEYKVNHNLFYQIPSVDNNGSESFTPVPYFKRKAINFTELALAGAEVSYPAMLAKLDAANEHNARYHVDHYSDIYKKLVYSKSSVIRTKILESTLVDNSKAVPYPLEDMLVNHWMAWACQGVYTARATLRLPGTKKDYTLSAEELLVLMVYSEAKLLGTTLTTIPTFYASRVIRPVAPTLQELQSVVSSSFVEDALLTQVLSTWRATTPITSVNQFYQKVSELCLQTLVHHKLTYGQGNQNAKVQMQIACSRLFEDVNLSSQYTGQTYDSFLTTRGLADDYFTTTTSVDLKNAIVDLISNYQLNASSTQKAVQRAMIKIFSQLTSYSTLIVGDMLDTAIDSGQGLLTGVQQWVGGGLDHQAVRVYPLNEFTNDASAADRNIVEVEALVANIRSSASSNQQTLDLPVTTVTQQSITGVQRMWVDNNIPTVLSLGDYYDQYDLLSPAQKQVLYQA
jgi:hypothetical protein